MPSGSGPTTPLWRPPRFPPAAATPWPCVPTTPSGLTGSITGASLASAVPTPPTAPTRTACPSTVWMTPWRFRPTCSRAAAMSSSPKPSAARTIRRVSAPRPSLWTSPPALTTPSPWTARAASGPPAATSTASWA